MGIRQSGSRSQGGETRCPCGSTPAFRQVVVDALEIDGRGDQDVLQMGLGLPDVARLAQLEGANALRERAFDARSGVVFGFPLGRLLCVSGGLEGLVLRFGVQREAASHHLARRTAFTRRTVETGLTRELDADELITIAVRVGQPGDRDLALRARDGVLRPVNLEGRDIVGALGARLPMAVGLDRADDANTPSVCAVTSPFAST